MVSAAFNREEFHTLSREAFSTGSSGPHKNVASKNDAKRYYRETFYPVDTQQDDFNSLEAEYETVPAFFQPRFMRRIFDDILTLEVYGEMANTFSMATEFIAAKTEFYGNMSEEIKTDTRRETLGMLLGEEETFQKGGISKASLYLSSKLLCDKAFLNGMSSAERVGNLKYFIERGLREEDLEDAAQSYVGDIINNRNFSTGLEGKDITDIFGILEELPNKRLAVIAEFGFYRTGIVMQDYPAYLEEHAPEKVEAFHERSVLRKLTPKN